MKILVRLPNWLGDMVMAAAFLRALQEAYPGAEISVIAKKGIHGLLPLFPGISHQHVFSKDAYRGFMGLLRFGRKVRRGGPFDLFFCLPDSFSSALMGYATGAKNRIGFKKEGRSFLLTHSYSKPQRGHRVEEYVSLLELYTGKKAAPPQVLLQHTYAQKDHIAVNINSEASSRRLTVPKAVEVIGLLRESVTAPLVLIGGPGEKAFVEEVYEKLPRKDGITSAAGRTALPQLAELLASARLLLTTDSGPAHLANALGTPTVVLFGAGNEANTAPYNSGLRTIIRLGQLSCEPCLKNKCPLYEVPQCLQQLESRLIVDRVKQSMANKQ
ncbi:glycosyltransferase family 9 protein [Paraflavisolibacter sp. H34]|uniref:glycosyltransferase family 9 protein n=1 Tax=Huijunlia imazamoxiresistens TaxID=3127457 RepID=UPI00301ACC84